MNDKALFDRRKTLFELLSHIRSFFNGRGFMEASVPLAVGHPGLEAHLHPFRLQSVVNKKETDLYLNTSPEFAMKELLSLGFEKIYALNWSFRDEPNATHHRPQFLMLEWYRAHEHYTMLMDETAELIKSSYEFLQQKKAPVKAFNELRIERTTVDELFCEHAGFSILDYLEDQQGLFEKIKKDFTHIPLPKASELSWDDLFFLLFLNQIDPAIANYPYLLAKIQA